ncbi:MAG: TlpA disulfide reductase family protein [Pseudomonadota bacterium]
MRVLLSPRLWLMIWLGIGAAGLLYVILAASLSGDRAKSPAKPSPIGDVLHDPALQVGEMADFTYAAELRTAPGDPFLHEGREMTLADFRGRAVLVNFWATWCAPCLKELPSLDALEGELGGDGFAVVAVAADPKGPVAAQAFLNRLKLKNLKLYADPKLSLAIATGGSAVLPVSILYDAQGREIGRLTGEADWTSAEAKALIRAAIASAAP